MHKLTLSLLANLAREKNSSLTLGNFRRSAGGESSFLAIMPRKRKATVVFCHGTGNDAVFPQLLLYRSLLEGQVGIFAFDLDGHGSESTTILSPDTFDDQIASAAESIHRTVEKGEKLHLAGYSVGAVPVLSSGVTLSVESRIVIAMPLGIKINSRTVWGEFRTAITEDFWRAVQIYGISEVIPALGPFKRKTFPIRLAKQTGKKTNWGYLAAIDQILEAKVAALRMSPPEKQTVHLIYGADDRIAPPEQGRTLVDLVPGATLTVIPQATHCSILYSRGLAHEILRLINEPNQPAG